MKLREEGEEGNNFILNARRKKKKRKLKNKLIKDINTSINGEKEENHQTEEAK